MSNERLGKDLVFISIYVKSTPEFTHSLLECGPEKSSGICNAGGFPASNRFFNPNSKLNFNCVINQFRLLSLRQIL